MYTPANSITPEGFTARLSALWRECSRSLMLMKVAFAHAQAGDGTASHERSEERLRDEQAWARMDDEGCPNGRQPPDSSQDIVRTGSRVASGV